MSAIEEISQPAVDEALDASLRRCLRCTESKPRSEFTTSGYCASCRRDYQREYMRVRNRKRREAREAAKATEKALEAKAVANVIATRSRPRLSDEERRAAEYSHHRATDPTYGAYRRDLWCGARDALVREDIEATLAQRVVTLIATGKVPGVKFDY